MASLLGWLAFAAVLLIAASSYLLTLSRRKDPYRTDRASPHWPPFLRIAWLGNALLVKVECPGCLGEKDQELYAHGWDVPHKVIQESYVFPGKAVLTRRHRGIQRHRYPGNIRVCAVCRGLGHLLLEQDPGKPPAELRKQG